MDIYRHVDPKNTRKNEVKDFFTIWRFFQYTPRDNEAPNVGITEDGTSLVSYSHMVAVDATTQINSSSDFPLYLSSLSSRHRRASFTTQRNETPPISSCFFCHVVGDFGHRRHTNLQRSIPETPLPIPSPGFVSFGFYIPRSFFVYGNIL